MPIKEKYKQRVNSIALKFFDNQCPHYLNVVFIKALESNLSLRTSYQKVQKPFRKTSTGQNTLSFIDPALWNKFPEEIKRTTKKILLDRRYDEPLSIYSRFVGMRPFSELFSANVLLLHRYKYIAFNIFSCRILIILYKMLIITGISNEKTNELTIYGKLCQIVKIFYWQELASLF